MIWDTIFTWTNGLAAVMWLALIAGPRKPAILAAVLYLGVGLLCAVYTVMIAGLIGMGGAGSSLSLADFSYSVSGLSKLFASPAVMVVGWTHFLAFDLFVGLWIARDADAKQFSRIAQAPVLAATFLAGPVGLLMWLAIRERRARASGHWS